MKTMTRNDLCAYIKQVEADEATWTKLFMFNEELALKPSGECVWWVRNWTYLSLEDAIAATRKNAISFYESCIKTYSPIVARFDRGEGEYDGWFTEKKIQHFRELLTLLPQWIEFLHQGKFLINCSDEEEKRTCESQWIDGYYPEKLGLCQCGKQLKYV